MAGVRTPAVAGRFYPADPELCAVAVDGYLAGVESKPGPPMRGLVVPHAGFVYSGPVAAGAYARLARGPLVERVLLLGPAHTVALRAMAVTSADSWMTPLGEVAIDTALRAACLGCDGVVEDDEPHVAEHALEVQLPFLQRALGRFTVTPIVVGAVPVEVVAALLEAVWADDVLVVLSTDLSHYHDDSTARELDRQTARAIAMVRPDSIEPHGACGFYPLRGLLAVAARRSLEIEQIDLRNSSQTAGGPHRVVGYGSFAISDPAAA